MPNQIIVVPQPGYVIKTDYGTRHDAAASPPEGEFDRFENLTQVLVQVPKSGVDAQREGD